MDSEEQIEMELQQIKTMTVQEAEDEQVALHIDLVPTTETKRVRVGLMTDVMVE